MADEDEYEYEEEEEEHEVEEEEHWPEESFRQGCGASSSEGAKTPRPSGLKELRVPDGGYLLTDLAEIVPYRENMVYEVSSLLELDRDSAQVLLHHFKWRKERLLDDFYSDKQEEVLKACGLDQYSPEVAARIGELRVGEQFKAAGGEGKECRICYDPQDRSPITSLGCGHMFHHSCYRDFLEHEISGGPACILTHCPETDCYQRVPRSLFSGLCSPSELAKYDLYVTRSFIEDSKTLRYCPFPGCDKVAIGSGVSTVKCSGCSHSFCFRCGEESHEPVSCEQLAAWNLKNSSESETANWILVNTKVCPACKARIEKNQGCNHMTCFKCKFHFCWICNGPWSEHGSETGGFYKCNKYEATKTGANASKAERAKQELERYLHYYQRYHGHADALKHAANTRLQTEKRMGDIQEKEKSSWIDVEFLKQANEQIIECRRVLKYTYVLGFFLEDNTAVKHLFEHQQEMLEKNTEQLHRHIEVSEDVDKTQVINLTRVTDKFLRSVLEEFDGGRTRNDFGGPLGASMAAEGEAAAGGGGALAKAVIGGK